MIHCIYMPGSDTGMSMAELVNEFIRQNEYADKTLGFSVDNAGNNGTMLKQLQDERDLKLSRHALSVLCACAELSRTEHHGIHERQYYRHS